MGDKEGTSELGGSRHLKKADGKWVHRTGLGSGSTHSTPSVCHLSQVLSPFWASVSSSEQMVGPRLLHPKML